MSNNDNLNSSNRWLGLQPFTEFHQDIFYGRTREVQDLLRRVEQRHLTVLFGKSGLGKTSLLRAGLVPKLRKARLFPIIHRIDHSLDSPPPVDQLKHAISEAIGVNIPRDLELSTWCHDTHERTNRESGLASESLRGVTPVIIIDQFEEVFTLGQQSELAMKRSQDYLRELADLVEVRIPERLENAFETGKETPEDYQFESSSYRLVFAIREDFLSDLERCRHLMPSLMDNRQPLDQLTGDKALEAVLGPGRDIVSESTAIEIVKCVAGPTQKERAIENIIVEPALLSLVCQQLDLRRGGRHITSSLLAGSEEKILENYYESCFEDLPPSVRKAIEKLVTKSGYRENIASESLTDEIGKENLQKLIDCRLLHTEVRDGQPRVELVHDVLTPLVMADRKAHEKEQAEQEKNALEQQILRKKHRRILFTALCSALAIVGWFAYRAHLSAETVKKQNITIQKQNKTIKMASAKLAISTKNLTNTILGTGAHYTTKN